MVKPASPGAIKLIAVGAVFQILAIIAFALRVWARKLKRRSLDASDWFILASSIVTFFLSLMLFAGAVIGGAGYHQSDLIDAADGNSGSLNNAAKIVFVAELMWLTTNHLTKMSTLAFYITLFSISRFRRVIWALMALTAAMYVGFVLKDFLICLPVQRNWTFDDPSQFCGVTYQGTLATGLGVTLMDVIIVFAPMPSLLKLQMPFMKKIFICGIFSIGLAVCIISALRINSSLRLDHSDLTYSIIDLGIFTLLEPLLAIIAVCLPTMHPVLLKISNSPLFDWTRRGSRSRKASTTGKRTNNTGGSTTLRGSQNSRVQNLNNTKNFNRLYDHLYPVTTTTITETSVRAHDEEMGLRSSSPWLQDRGGKGGISVTKEFKVDSVHITSPTWDKPLPSVPEGRSERDIEMGPVSGQTSRGGGRTPDMAEPVSPMSMEAPGRRF